jgi:hypothetical protein
MSKKKERVKKELRHYLLKITPIDKEYYLRYGPLEIIVNSQDSLLGKIVALRYRVEMKKEAEKKK